MKYKITWYMGPASRVKFSSVINAPTAEDALTIWRVNEVRALIPGKDMPIPVIEWVEEDEGDDLLERSRIQALMKQADVAAPFTTEFRGQDGWCVRATVIDTDGESYSEFLVRASRRDAEMIAAALNYVAEPMTALERPPGMMAYTWPDAEGEWTMIIDGRSTHQVQAWRKTFGEDSGKIVVGWKDGPAMRELRWTAMRGKNLLFLKNPPSCRQEEAAHDSEDSYPEPKRESKSLSWPDKPGPWTMITNGYYVDECEACLTMGQCPSDYLAVVFTDRERPECSRVLLPKDPPSEQMRFIRNPMTARQEESAHD